MAGAAARRPPPAVSVVMTFLDAEAFIADALASALAQTSPVLEVVAVNDGSTDASSAIVAGFAERDTRVRLLSHPDGANHGTSASRNLGIAEARGDLVAFLDADDLWEPNHLEEQLAALALHPEADAVCGRALYWRSWQAGTAPDEITPLAFPPGTLVRPPAMLERYLQRGFLAVPMCSLLVRRAMLEMVGGADEHFRGVYDDAVLLAKLHLHAASVMCGAVTARYRQHSASTCHRAIDAGDYQPSGVNPARGRYLTWLADYVAEVRADDVRLRATIDAELARYRPGWLVPLRQAAHRTRRRVAAEAPAGLRQRWHRWRTPALSLEWGPLRLGMARRLTPLSRSFGYERGRPIDRHYIESFLAAHAGDVRGRVLEVGDDSYTRRFGGERVRRAEVLHVDATNPRADHVGDLARGAGLPDEAFDCVLLTQTLQLVEDLRGAATTLHRILRPGGTLLATFPGIAYPSADEWAGSWLWSLTPLAARRLFAPIFGPDAVEVAAHGNVLAATRFLWGMAAEELRAGDLARHDPQYPMLVTLRAVKAPSPARDGSVSR